jgi:hypothetical protein
MDIAKLFKVLEVYFEAFAEHDPVRRGELLAQCLTPDCAIWGHSHVYAGHVAISEKIAGFHANFPDCRLVLASGLMTFDNMVRSANAIVRRDGSVVARGESSFRDWAGRPAMSHRSTLGDELAANSKVLAGASGRAAAGQGFRCGLTKRLAGGRAIS